MSLIRASTTRAMERLTPEQMQSYETAIVGLGTILQASERIVTPALDQGTPGSRIERARERELRDPYEHARLLVTTAEDHFWTILSLLEAQTLPMFALYSLLRPAAAAAARCAHLADPGISETDRLARGLTARLENLREQHKVIRDEVLLEARTRNLEARAERNDITSARDRNGDLLGFGEPPKSELELVRAYLPEGELVYRFLSGHVHAMAWVKLSKERAIPSDEPGISLMPMGLDVVTFTNALAIVVDRHEQNLRELMVLAGFPWGTWDEAKKTGVRESAARISATRLRYA